MNCIFNKIVDWLEKLEEIEGVDKELYLYALKSIFLSISPIVLSLFVGILLHCPFRSILIILPFVILRKFSGGYHMKSEIGCVFFSTILIVECTMISCRLSNSTGIFLIMTGAAVSLICLSPIDHENRRLSEKEKKKCKRWTMILAFTFFLADSLFFLLAIPIASDCLGIGLILAAVLQYPCLLDKTINRIGLKHRLCFKPIRCALRKDETDVVKGKKKKYNT